MYKVVIGLEVHCELSTASKGFSPSRNTFTDKPNTNVTPIDLCFPGVLPYVNKEAVHKALKTSLALNCTPPDELIFDRKNYFYPDLPKGYQLTQLTKPVGKNGYLMIRVNGEIKKIDIHQIHLEEDTASLEHFSQFSLLDYNRSCIPLIETVTEPCIYSADEAVAFLETFRNLLLYCGVSEADSKKGQIRCDVNISLMKDTDTELGTKIEMKNINKFSNVRNSIEYEIKRQTKILEAGEKVKQETRRYSEEDEKTYAMREKADAIDYKYYLDANLPPVKLSNEYIEKIRNEIPMLQFERIEKYINEIGLSEKDAKTLSRYREISDYFNKVLNHGINSKDAANWVTTVILATLNKLDIKLEELFITPLMLSNVIKLVSNKELSLDHAKKIVYRAIAEKKDPLNIINDEGLKQINDTDFIKKAVSEALTENPDQVTQYLEGKDYIANFFVGKVMIKTNRQANPGISLEIIKEELEKRR